MTQVSYRSSRRTAILLLILALLIFGALSYAFLDETGKNIHEIFVTSPFNYFAFGMLLFVLRFAQVALFPIKVLVADPQGITIFTEKVGHFTWDKVKSISVRTEVINTYRKNGRVNKNRESAVIIRFGESISLGKRFFQRPYHRVLNSHEFVFFSWTFSTLKPEEVCAALNGLRESKRATK